jgi:hypothetical protein
MFARHVTSAAMPDVALVAERRSRVSMCLEERSTHGTHDAMRTVTQPTSSDAAMLLAATPGFVE